MDTQELRKIINDGYTKFKAFEEGKDALKALDALKQSEVDITKRVIALTNQKSGLEVAVLEAERRVVAAADDAKRIVAEAKDKAEKLLLAAGEKIEAEKTKASKELAAISAEVLKKMELVKQNDEKIADQSKELASITAALAKAKEKLKGFMGE